MLDRPQQTGYFRLWQGMIAWPPSVDFGAVLPTSKGPKDVAGALRGVPAACASARARRGPDSR
jgi:hypothetical protein